MSLFKGAVALRRYRVMQKMPGGWRAQFEKSIRAHALVPIDREGNEVQSTGWCSVYDAQKLDFEVEYVEGYLLLSLRMDVLKPDAGEVKKRVKLAARRIEVERGGTPLSKAALRDVKAMVVLDMRKSTPIKTRTVDVLWNLDAQRLYVLSHSKKANALISILFAKTFNIPLDIEGPGFWAEQYAHGMANELDEVAAKYQCGSTADERAGAERIDAIRLKLLRACKPTPELLGGFRGLRPCVMAATPDAQDSKTDDATPDTSPLVEALTDRRYLGREFLTWLVWKAEGDGTTFEGDNDSFKVNLGSRVLCKSLGDGGAEIVARGDDPLEVRYAIAGGLTVRDLDVLLSQGDRLWSLAVSAENFDLKRVKLPALLSEEDTEQAHERLDLLGAVDSMLQSAYAHFLSVRLSADWPAAVGAMRIWLKDSIEPDGAGMGRSTAQSRNQ